jgi:hypothetical protein
MMTRKEYAISLGLAKPGRGRMSKEAHEAISQALADGYVFAEGSSVTPIEEPVYVKDKEMAVRSITGTLIGYTAEGWRVGFDTCSACKRHANYCPCPNGILAPSIVKSIDTNHTSMVVLGHN